MLDGKHKENTEDVVRLGGGPLGLGDPDDLRLRKTERDIILPKLIREEAKKKCTETIKVLVECSKTAGFLFPFKCKEANTLNNECLLLWCKNPELVKEVTDKYLKGRSHYRRTGEPLERYERKKSPSSSGFC